MIPALANLRNRVTGLNLTRLSDWSHIEGKNYPISSLRPQIMPADIPDDEYPDLHEATPEADLKTDDKALRQQLRKHTDQQVKTVIDIPTWIHAQWSMVAYATYPAPAPRYLTLFSMIPRRTTKSSALAEAGVQRRQKVDRV